MAGPLIPEQATVTERNGRMSRPWLALFRQWGAAIGNNVTPGGLGNVTGAASSTDNAIARFDGTSGQTLQNSGITIADGASGTLSGTNSGDVALAGTPNYLTIAGQVITRALINLASHVTGRLPFANFVAATAASRLVGRRSGSAGDFEEISLGSGLTMSAGGVLDTAASGGITQLTGDVTAGPGSGSQAATIANDAVTNAKAANMAQSTIKGRAAGAGTGDPTDLTATQATAILDVAVGDSGAGGTKGLVPAPAAGDAAAGKFLKADMTYAAPSGGGGGGGGLVLLESHTASASSSLDFTTRNASGQSGATFQSDYDEYLVELVNVVPATDARNLLMRFSEDGGSTFKSGASDYQWDQFAWRNGASGTNGLATDSAFTLSWQGGTTGVSNVASNGGLSGYFRIYNPLSTTITRHYLGQTTSWSTATNTPVGCEIAGRYLRTGTAVNAVRFVEFSGNITSGTIRIYGIAK